MSVVAEYPCLGTPFTLELRHKDGDTWRVWVTGGGHDDRPVMTFSDEMPALIYASALQATAMYDRERFMSTYDKEEE